MKPASKHAEFLTETQRKLIDVQQKYNDYHDGCVHAKANFIPGHCLYLQYPPLEVSVTQWLLFDSSSKLIGRKLALDSTLTAPMENVIIIVQKHS